MKAEIPATGILKRNEWGDTKCYQIVCNCGDSDHDHNVWVEADDHEVSIIIYTKNTTPFWSTRRWHQMWELLVRGYVKQEVAISMNEQQAMNYAETLKSAVEDVKGFRKK
jgi:hypothetical protein